MPDQVAASWYSERHVRVHAPGRGAVATLQHYLGASPPTGLVDVVTGRDSLLLEFDLASTRVDDVLSQIDALVARWSALPQPSVGGVCVVPFCADPDLAPDLEALAAERRMTSHEFVQRFVAATYTVDFVGFMPGFGYLEGLPAELAATRLDRPRVRVPAGSVAIGGDRAGVYPFESSGGWRLIGRTNVRLFDVSRSPPSLFVTGMKVRFEVQDRAAFESSAAFGSGSA